MLATQPVFAYFVSFASRYASNPDFGQWQAVKKIFRYLRGIIKLKLRNRGNLQPLTGYTHAD